MIYSSLQDPAMFVFQPIKKGLTPKRQALSCSLPVLASHEDPTVTIFKPFTNIGHPCLPRGGNRGELMRLRTALF